MISGVSLYEGAVSQPQAMDIVRLRAEPPYLSLVR
jgi:hypothetical protein